MTAPVRIAGPGDAAALLRLKQSLDTETSFMLLETDERETSVQDLASELGAAAQSGNSVVIVADSGGELAGYVELGFGVEGRRAQCLLIGGEFVDELYMAVLLG
ncbi:MAG TPA: hypothetical protein VKU77_19215 [Streptosporangiaceae bacterium]|nr:hypothetical protein [Streptosporangiaceae bacterium]